MLDVLRGQYIVDGDALAYATSVVPIDIPRITIFIKVC